MAVPNNLDHINMKDVPNDIDWRTKGVVTPVKNQGGCGSCWAFAATETIESGLAIATGKLLTLSEQNMVSCTKNPRHCGGTGGCQGATAELGIDYVAQKGISSESVYPYTARTGTCKETTKAAHVTNFTKLPENKYDHYLKLLALLVLLQFQYVQTSEIMKMVSSTVAKLDALLIMEFKQ